MDNFLLRRNWQSVMAEEDADRQIEISSVSGKLQLVAVFRILRTVSSFVCMHCEAVCLLMSNTIF